MGSKQLSENLKMKLMDDYKAEEGKVFKMSLRNGGYGELWK